MISVMFFSQWCFLSDTDSLAMFWFDKFEISHDNKSPMGSYWVIVARIEFLLCYCRVHREDVWPFLMEIEYHTGAYCVILEHMHGTTLHIITLDCVSSF